MSYTSLWRYSVPILAGILAAFNAPGALAQGAYPDHPIRMILPFWAGGGTDVVGRIIWTGPLVVAIPSAERSSPRLVHGMSCTSPGGPS